MELGLDGRVAVVSGASAGLGRAITVALAAEGVQVLAVARRRPLLEELAAEVAAAGHPTPAVLDADVTGAATPARVHDEVTARFGRLDVLVNNAGGSRPTTWDAPDEVWEESLALNFHAGRRLTQTLLPVMIAAGWGRVINVTGASEPRDVNAASPAKAAVHVWAKGLSRVVGGHGITVNCIPPGRIESEQIGRLHPTAESEAAFVAANVPLGRFGVPEELAALAVFLASDAARYITGQNVSVDGGMQRFAF